MFGGARPEVVEALRAYGEIVGSAFQLSDDILDIASESDTSGKTPGTDLREGVPTLPVLMAQASTDPADARLLELLGRPLTDDAEHAEALDAAAPRTPRWTRPATTSSARPPQAKKLLEVLDPGPVRTALESFADIVANRSAWRSSKHARAVSETPSCDPRTCLAHRWPAVSRRRWRGR